MKALVEAYFAALNAERWADLAAVFAPDIEIHTVGLDPVHGREAALAHFPAALAGYAAHTDRVTRWITAPDALVCEIAFTGRLRDGRPITFAALDVFDGTEAAITRIGTWFDTRAVARQVRG